MMDKEIIELGITEIKTKEAALTYLASKLAEKGLVTENFTEAILEREKIFPTGLQLPGYGVAIPHTDTVYVRKPQIAVLTLKDPVSFIQMGTSDTEVAVDVIIMLAIKEAHKQVDILQKVIHLIQDTQTIGQIRTSLPQDKQTVANLLQQKIMF